MKSMVYLLAVLIGIGSGAIASAQCMKQDQEATKVQSEKEQSQDNVVTFWRYEMVTVTPQFNQAESYSVDRHHPAHPANQDRIYHRTVVIQLPETDLYSAGFEAIRNPNPVHQL